MDIKELIANIIFTNRCAVCDGVMTIDDPNDACAKCTEEMHEHLKNAPIVINDKNIMGDKFLFSYKDETVRDIVLRMKYQPLHKACRYFANIAADCIESDLSFPEFDIITHCPRKLSRKRSVGYDHSQHFARLLAKRLNKPYVELLGRYKGGKEQKKVKSLRERQKNIENKFYARNFQKAKDKRVLIVDDIITTGSTAKECARVLREAGVRNVSALFILD